MNKAQVGQPETRRVALLRGINVGGGNRIAMADLRACTESAGCSEVSTVLATGNVVFTDARTGGDLRTALETAYSERFDYRAVVQALTREALVAAVDGYPFDTLAEHHDYVVFSDSAEVTARVVEDMTGQLRPGTTESVATGPGCIYWRVPRGSTLQSAASKVLAARANKTHLTTRNIKTLRKILAVG